MTFTAPAVANSNDVRHPSSRVRLPEKFVQDQCGHTWGSTTAIYTGVSDEYRNRLVQRAFRDRTQICGRTSHDHEGDGYRWHLRLRMAERGYFQTSDLVPLLTERGIELSREQVFRLVT